MNDMKSVFYVLVVLIGVLASCKSNDPSPTGGSVVPGITTNDTAWKTQEILDDYSTLAAFSNYKKWGSYNVHDPACIKDGDWYYTFSTDVMYGISLERIGIQVRKSQDLVQWKFVGWAFSGIPSEALSYVKANNDGTSPENMWAPFVIKVDDTYRLYYSVSVFGSNASFIGLATSTSLEGPWVQKGAVIKTTKSNVMNAIDPSIVTNTSTGEQWMAYGSFFGGLYVVQLDPSTGLTLVANDKGKLIARNGQSGNAIEAPELIYNATLGKYYLFVSYNNLASNYNIRVGRSDSPNGPFLDMFGNDMAELSDNWPILTAPYQFNGHSGWQGVAHCGVVSDGSNYFVLHQGRLGSNAALMNLHVRKIVWNEAGWPSFSPQRYRNIAQTPISNDSLIGDWEEIVLEPTVGSVKNPSNSLQFNTDGSITGKEGASWQVNGNILSVTLNALTTKLAVSREWDWEKKQETFVYTGINSEGKSIWGKRLSK
jgi:arabinan endo-1,5-alpha-L-arabinosidase